MTVNIELTRDECEGLLRYMEHVAETEEQYRTEIIPYRSAGALLRALKTEVRRSYSTKTKDTAERKHTAENDNQGKHTPERLTVDFPEPYALFIRDSDGRRIATLDLDDAFSMWDYENGNGQQFERARRFAASSELLAALELCLPLLLDEWMGTDGLIEGGKVPIEAAQAAITKARGQAVSE